MECLWVCGCLCDSECTSVCVYADIVSVRLLVSGERAMIETSALCEKHFPVCLIFACLFQRNDH